MILCGDILNSSPKCCGSSTPRSSRLAFCFADYYEDALLSVVFFPNTQRLRDLKQLGCCSFVFPSATHSRFEHSIGVCYLAGKMLRKIATNQPELVRELLVATSMHHMRGWRIVLTHS